MNTKLLKLTLALLLSLSTLALLACEKAPSLATLQESNLVDFARDTLIIETADSKQTEFAVYVAQSDSEMRQGLMFVRDLPAQTGMLFLYSQPRTGSMWMKNTFISLDILFVKSNGQISDIAATTTPQSLKSIRSTVAVKGAIELPAGSAEKFGIAVGDLVIHPYFQIQ